MQCPNCNHKRQKAHAIIGVYECPRCGAIHGQCYKGDSYSIVKRSWHSDPDPAQKDLFYYDLTVLGSDGVNRIHGWAHKTTRQIVQTG